MTQFEKLKAKLAELFQLDQADLDFGIYRIMNARRDEIIRFLDKDLLPQVRDAFAEYKSADKAQIQAELDRVIEGLRAGGVDPEQAPKVQKLRAKLAEEAVDITALENEVYDHLYSFFSRYYDEGDFISLRRYKKGVYAIPYEGEEVKLHWANADQYYIKTTEDFRDFAFRTPSGHRVHFKIAEADTEKDNIKASNGKDRRFLLHGDRPVAEEDGELVVRFEYRPNDEGRRQDAINADTVRRVIEDLNDDTLAVWQHRLSEKWRRADGTQTERTVLEKRLDDYTKKNTFDYFIHKDLGGFLRRELDFYIKNEVMRLDDIEEESAPRVEQYLSKIKVIRRIAHKIIDFLAQIEDFQKRLWLKKKFVVETNYCVTLDRVPEEFYPEITRNDAQREEWVRLFAIDELKKDLAGAVDYSAPLTVEFLKANASLMVDTRFFDVRFKDKVIASIDDVDARADGLLIHADNFHALQALSRRFQSQIDCVYIDPPYNTGKDEFVYKDSYQSSSWLSSIDGRTRLAHSLLTEQGVFLASIADHEVDRMRLCLHEVFGRENLLATLVWNNEGNIDNQSKVKINHEYILAYCRNERAYPHARVIAPDIGQGSKLYNEIIENSITKNGPGNPPSEVELPTGFPAAFKEGSISPRTDEWPHIRDEVEVRDSVLAKPVRAYSGWSSRNLLDAFLGNDCKPIKDSKGLKTWFKLTHTGAIYCYKTRENQSHVLSIIRNVGTVKKTSGMLDRMGFTFSYPKPVGLIEYVLQFTNVEGAVVLDYYAGSGTMAHAAISLQRRARSRRKYILVDNGAYFSTVIRPRIKKVVYSGDWKDRKPISRDSGISHMFKYIRLESYEDALANINLRRTKEQQSLLDEAEGFRESYMLKYMLDVESKDSQTLLNVEQFDDPFSYKLLVGTGSAGETKPVNVDLVETFNWLLGLKVRHVDCIEGFRVVEGTSPKDERVLVIWRKIRDLSETDPEKIAAAREKANHELEAFFRKQQYNTLDTEYDLIYVNGDNNLMNVPLDPDTEGVEPRYKVRLIEEEFKKLMFDVKDV